jgi:hypothetical protein
MRQRSGSDRVWGLIPWIPAIAGIGSLTALLVIAAIRLAPWSTAPHPLPPPQPPLSLPMAPATTAPTPGSAVTVPVGRPTAVPAVNAPEGPAANPTPTRPATRPSTRPTTRPATTTAPPPSPVTGRYQVNNSYGDSFIGQVMITNAASSARDWTVTLVFPAGVGRLRTSWLEGQPQPTLTRSGQTYTWTSTVPLAAGTSGPLRFMFDRSGTAERPSRCTTNGQACR